MTIPKAMQPGVLSRLKIMGSLDIAERRQPQDGRVLGALPRQAVRPSDRGPADHPRRKDRAAFLQRATAQGSLPELGMSKVDADRFLSSIRQPHGAVIVCGPTGSGKTTTLYTGLGILNDPGRVLMTIEDPVEYQIEGISQIEVNVRSGLTFARGLRTILRSDPDVLLVGEVRDDETARIAIQSAMTGHLVLTSLHTHDAASAIARLADMGIELGLISSSVTCIVAQRLARRLCVECREAYTASDGGNGRSSDAGGSMEDLKLWRSCRMLSMPVYGLSGPHCDVRSNAALTAALPARAHGRLDRGDLRNRTLAGHAPCRKTATDNSARRRDLLAGGDSPTSAARSRRDRPAPQRIDPCLRIPHRGDLHRSGRADALGAPPTPRPARISWTMTLSRHDISRRNWRSSISSSPGTVFLSRRESRAATTERSLR